MIRFLFRLLALFALVAAVIAGTIDATRSVAANALRLMSLGMSWSSVSPGSLAGLHRLAVDNLPPQIVAAFDWLLDQPAAAVLLAVALILYLPGYRPRRRRGGRYALS